MPDEATDPVVILYTNWRGKTDVRRIVPGSPDPALVSQWFGSSEWHLSAYDLDKGAYRDFARSGVKAWGQEAVDAALSAPPAAQDGWRDIATAPKDGPFRIGRKVPQHVYEGDRPLFTAATEEEAARLVSLLNGAPPST